MGWIKAKIAKLLHMEMASANIKNVYNPLINFYIVSIFLLIVIIGISIIYSKEIIAYICLSAVIIIIIVCIVAYSIRSNFGKFIHNIYLYRPDSSKSHYG